MLIKFKIPSPACSLALACLALTVGLDSGAFAQNAAGASVSVEGLYLERGNSPRGGTFLTTPSDGTDPVAETDPDRFDLGGSGGVRIMAAIPVGTVIGGKLEIGGFWSDRQSGSFAFGTGPENYDSRYDNHPGNEFNSFNADIACCLTATLRTSLYGGEANFTAPIGGAGLTVFAGPRYIAYREKLGVSVYDDLLSYQGVFNNVDDILLKVSNDLYGAQIGAEVSVPLITGVRFTGRLSGGLYANRTSVSSTISDRNGFNNPLTKSYSSTGFAQGVEFLPTLSFDLTKNITLDIGGQLFYVNNIAEASKQFEYVADNDANSIKRDSDLFYYGLRAGLTVKLD